MGAGRQQGNKSMSNAEVAPAARHTQAPWGEGYRHLMELGPLERYKVLEFLQSTKDPNLIHIHPDEARKWCEQRKTRMPQSGQCIVPGMFILSVISGRLAAKFGQGTSLAGFNDAMFKRPLFTGEAPEAALRVLSVEEAGPDWQLAGSLTISVKTPARTFELAQGTITMRVPRRQ